MSITFEVALRNTITDEPIIMPSHKSDGVTEMQPVSGSTGGFTPVQRSAESVFEYTVK